MPTEAELEEMVTKHIDGEKAVEESEDISRFPDCTAGKQAD